MKKLGASFPPSLAKRLVWICAGITLFGAVGAAQAPDVAPFSLFDLPRMKTFSAHRVSSNNRFVGSNDDSKRIMPGETFVMADLRGPGVVNHIWITVADNEYAWPRLVRLRVYYDGKKTPSVDVPLGDFFGVGHGYERDLDSMPVRVSSFGRARNSYWPMPFRQSCKITVTDEGNRPVTAFYYHVDWQKHASLPADIAYFHGYYRQERPAVSGKNYEFLNVKGTGHYVGTVLNVIQAQVGWFGEGDDLFYVDGAKKPQIYGTGTEDYVNEAWGLRVSYGPWSGTPVAEGERVGARLTGYRWHVPDPSPIYQIAMGRHRAHRLDLQRRRDASIRLRRTAGLLLEHRLLVSERRERGSPRAAVRRSAPAARQCPADRRGGLARRGDRRKGKSFGAAGSGLGQRPAVLRSGGHRDLASTFRSTFRRKAATRSSPASRKRPTMAITMPCSTANPRIWTTGRRRPPRYRQPVRKYSTTICPKSTSPWTVPLAGWTWKRDGTRSVSSVWDGTAVRPATTWGSTMLCWKGSPGPLRQRRSLALPSALQTGGIVYRGRPLSAYLQQLKQASDSNRAEIVRAIGAFGEDAGPAVKAVAEALTDPDPDTRAAAAWALSQMAAAGAPAIPALEKAIADVNPRVRSLSAVALRSMGPKAVDAVPALVQALSDPAAYVRAPAADAIGSIGPAAKAAVQPLIERLLTTGEQVYVLRSVASALGNIGPDAAGALPALQQALKMHRVTYTAQEAILKIKKEPVPTWF